MALSDTIIKNVGPYWRLRLVWTATQNVGTNTSSVTAKLYWEAQRSGVGNVTSGTSRTGSVTINGSTSTFSTSASIDAGGSKLLKTYTVPVVHNADGTKSFSLSGSFNLSGLRLSGVDYGNQSVSDTATLNTIPRASGLSSSASWTAGSNKTFTVSRGSTAFRHELVVYVKNTGGTWVSIKRLYIPATTTSVSSAFTTAEVTAIFTNIAQRASAETQVIVQTYKGEDLIGSTWHYGTVTAPAASTTSFGGSSFAVGDDLQGLITQSNPNFTHTIQLIFTGTTYTLFNKTTVSEWTYATSAISSSLYGKMGTVRSLAGVIRIYTYYNGVQVQNYKQSNITAVIEGSTPTFSSTDIAYSDINTATTAITGNNQYIIQGKSSLQVRVVNPAIPKDGATISYYAISIESHASTIASTGSKTVGILKSSSNVTLTVKAVDSRGFSKTVSKTVQILPYAPPIITAFAERADGYESATTLSLSGSISPINIGGVPKNDISSVNYQYRAQNGSFTTPVNFVLTKNLPNFVGANRSLFLEKTQAWEILVTATDSLGATTSKIFVQTGQPLWFYDWAKKSIAFNDFPQGSNEFRLNGQLVMGANMWAISEGVFGAINMRNSDIVNLNAAYFQDPADTNSEGFNWLKTGKTQGSSDIIDYDNFRILDGRALLNGVPVFNQTNQVLWTGAYFMQAGQNVNPSRTLSQCVNGWVLVWSDFASGANNWDVVYSFIPKVTAVGGHTAFIIPASEANSNAYTIKTLTVSNTGLAGVANNSTGINANNVVLRAVYEW